MRSLILTGAALLAAANLAQAQILQADDFSYTGLLTANGWVAHSGAGAKALTSNGSYVPLDQSSGSGEDAYLAFAAQGATATTFASFRMRVNTADLSGLDANGLYCAHLKDSGFNYRARTGVLGPASGGDWLIAINADSSGLGAGTAWASDQAFDTWYTVVISWDASTGTSELWLDPVDELSTSITHTGTNSGDVIESFALRQSNDYTGFIDIDDLVVGKSFDDVTYGGPIAGPEVYCTAGPSASGCTALISTSDFMASATATSGFTVDVTGVEGQKNGLIFFGITGKTLTPWGTAGSYMCVAPPRYRTPVQQGVGTLGACDGAMTIDFNALWCPSCPFPTKNFGAGTVCDSQLWYRDPFNTGMSPGKTSLSNALEFVVGP
jgi:hypothetical protein